MKHVVVTGAASGLGNYLANMFADKGYIVYGLDLDKKKLDEISNKNIIPLLCDITKEAEWDNVLLRKVEEDGQGIDIVIACASIMHIGNAGNILFIGSPSALLAVRDEVCYVTFKHAIRGLSKSVAFDFGEAGVRANVVHPGWIRTAMSDEEMKEIMKKEGCGLDEAYAIATRFVPLRRPATLLEIGNAVDFLTSEAASYITGTELSVDGGLGIVDPGMVAFGYYLRIFWCLVYLWAYTFWTMV